MKLTLGIPKLTSTKSIAAAFLVGVLTIGSGCASSGTHRSTGQTVDDDSLTAQVKTALVRDPATKARQIHVTSYRGEVELAGFVDSADEKSEAGKVARGVSGVKNVRNDLQVRSVERSAGTVLDDTVITAKVKAALVGDSRTKAFQIEVNTNQGVVQLAGFVDDATAKTAATEVAEGISGVKSVRNNLEVKS
jgi:hyperosmotically inducible protein